MVKKTNYYIGKEQKVDLIHLDSDGWVRVGDESNGCVTNVNIEQ